MADGKGHTDFFLLLSDTMHSTSSSLQLVHGAPCSVTLQRTLRARQHWQALEALLLTERPVVLPSRPAWAALRLGGWWVSTWSDGEVEHSDMATLLLVLLVLLSWAGGGRRDRCQSEGRAGARGTGGDGGDYVQGQISPWWIPEAAPSRAWRLGRLAIESRSVYPS